MSLLVEIADRIAIMYAGQIIEDGAAMDLYHGARHPYTRGLINSFPPLHGQRRELGGIPGSPPDMSTLGGGCPFAERCPYVRPECADYATRLKPTGIQGDDRNHQVSCLLYERHKQGYPLPEALADS
jgi:peptide/nickel transport system ATP-binding protein